MTVYMTPIRLTSRIFSSGFCGSSVSAPEVRRHRLFLMLLLLMLTSNIKQQIRATDSRICNDNVDALVPRPGHCSLEKAQLIFPGGNIASDESDAPVDKSAVYDEHSSSARMTNEPISDSSLVPWSLSRSPKTTKALP